jgi:GNAT superfamily N-acetyltransferase
MIEWTKLQRSSEPLTTEVTLDELTSELVKPFDYDTNGTEKFFPFIVPEDLPKDFGIGIIVGASGTGKSTLLKTFSQPKKLEWAPDRTVASHFDSPIDANERLSAAGLLSVPEWVKPYHSLSNGQQFRADLARSLNNGAVIDEFTSVVDRNVAKAASTSMSRYVRKNGLKNIVLASCHRDILEYLEPDWVIDTDRGEWASGRYLHRPELVLEIRSCSNALWSHFAKHHYLSESLNKAAHCYMALWEGQLVGFVASLAYPSGTVQNAFREHRLVVHPDYQGFGIGPRLSEAIANHYVSNGKRYFSKTSHPRLGEYRDNSPVWKPTSKNHMKRTDGMNLEGKSRWSINPERWSYSHEYIGTSRSV